MIDATSAYYVVGTSLKGPWGIVGDLRRRAGGKRLAEEHGGRVLRFDQIDQALLQEAASMQHGGMHEHMPADRHNAHAGH